MRKLSEILIIITMVMIGCTNASKQSSTKVEIKDNWYYINGEKFFIKGIGYEIGARPGQNPYEDSIVMDLERVRYDLKFLKDGGFNTIRTWSQLSEKQLQIVQESGLKIIFGIWIKPEKDYDDSTFMKESVDLVNKVVAYTKKYDCVISYLILNEPATDHIHKCGAKNTATMLAALKGIINKEHPGIPVSISGNAAIGDYMDMNLLDYYGYNCYDYGDGQTGTMSLKGFLKWCNEMNGKKKPLVLTEFGYSVSDRGWGRYGGNTLEAQRDGVLKNYREILDAGATGACPFYYADGWWKGGDDSIHNDTAEEWFGFVGYSDLHDTIGTPRPVWYAIKTYMKGLILTPKNQEIYTDVIPLELYLDAMVGKVVVKLHDSILYSKQVVKEGYLADTIKYQPKGIEDAELAFEFYDKAGNFIKSEIIYALLSKGPVKLPEFTIDVTPSEDLDKAKVCKMKIRIAGLGDFQIASDVRYNFRHHIGWESGKEGDLKIGDMKNKKEIILEEQAEIADKCWIMTVSAGVSVKYGKVTIRLHDQKLLFRGNWYEGIGRRDKK
jgi:exo-beta-1,3-glucanase (GH17 family)